MESSIKTLLKQTTLKASLQLKQTIMKAINTNTKATIIDGNILYSSDKNATLGFTLLNENEKLELTGFSKVELEGKTLKLTK